MQPKPDFLGEELGSAFQEASVAGSYRQRPPYPAATFDLLADLVVDQPRHVLDVGCGTSFLARNLAGRVAHVESREADP